MAENPTPPPVPPSPSQRASDVSARLQHLRNLLSSERHGNLEQRRAMEALDREMRDMSAEPISSRLDRRRRELEAQVQEHGTVLTSESPTSNPATLTRSRRRAVRPSERLLRHRERLSLVHGGMEETATMIERPPPPIEPSEVAIQEYQDEAQVNRENRWRAKRRKLDDGTFEEEGRTFSYGHKGQVIPGPLKLEIVSCDGGEYSEPNVGHSLPQHVLQDDNTVYCTKGNRCNMLLKHVGGMPVSMTKLVIKAPDNGYDAPIQEGMIFVAMDDDKFLEKTEQYEIRYSPRSYRYHYRRPDHYELHFRPSREYLNSARSPLRSIDRSRYLHDPYPHREPDEMDRLLETALIPGFNVTTSFEDSEDADRGLQRESWQESTFPNFNFDPSRLLRTYVDDHYRPTYDRIAFSDGSASTSESEHDDSVSDHNQETPRSPRLANHPAIHRERERLLARSTSLSRPISRHGVPPASTTDMEAALSRQRHLLSRMRMPPGEWDRWTRDYLRMEMEHSAGANRRSTPSRIEIRNAADGTSARPAREDSDRQTEVTAGDRAEALTAHETTTATTTTTAESNSDPQPAQTSLRAPRPSSPATAKPRRTTTPASSSASPTPLPPHARFFIRRDKSVVSIKFDPPVAGRYILIKLWAPCPNANIDIQSIVAHGYGGPRFFPSQEVR